MTKLYELQKWFGTSIARPFQEDPFGSDIKKEAAHYITPSPTLEPHQRLELYHKQYWWRLLSCLQENFPALTCLYSPERFNQEIGIPYLVDHPPTHWALCRLGQTLPNWLKGKDLEHDLARIEAATQRAFWIGEGPLADLESEKVALQPHVHLFALGGDLFTFRENILEGEELPKEVEARECYFALYRNPANQVKWKELSKGEYHLLTLFQKGSSIEAACAQIEEEGGEIYKEAQELLPLWFREWTVLKWFQEV